MEEETRNREIEQNSRTSPKADIANMNSSVMERLYNCSAWIFEYNVTLLSKLNRSELAHFIEEALNRSTQRDFLRELLSNCIFVNQERPFDLPWWPKLCWSLFFGVIILIATGGNIIVMWIVLGKKTDCMLFMIYV